MKALDLFRGAGGWSVACRELGITDHGVELMPEANATAEAAGFQTLAHDVTTLDYAGLQYDGLIASPPCQTFSTAGKGAGRKALDSVLQAIDVMAGRWDMAHMPPRVEFDDPRTALVLEPLRYALTMRPRWIALEQVPPVLPVWDAMADVLRREGYHVWTGNLQAEQYGVPQTRKRAFLLAHAERPVTAPEPTHSRYYPRNPAKLDEVVLPWVSMAEALGWGIGGRPAPTITGGGTETGGAEPIGHLSRYTGRDDWTSASDAVRAGQPFEVVSNYGTGGNPRNRGRRAAHEPAATVTEKVGRNRVVLRNNTSKNAAVRTLDQPAGTMYFGQRANGVYWETLPEAQARNSGPGAARNPRPVDEPSYTIRAQGSGSHPSGVEWVHERPATTVNGDPRISRPGRHDPAESGSQQRGAIRVTVQEAGILQSFPADYPWQGSKTKQYLQVGNAVPPKLAQAVLSSLLDA